MRLINIFIILLIGITLAEDSNMLLKAKINGASPEILKNGPISEICSKSTCIGDMMSVTYSSGGFAGKPFIWDYSFYVPPGTTDISTDDPTHITWDGLLATINYSTAGDYYVKFIANSTGGKNLDIGLGKIHIVNEKVWGLHSHRAMWDDRNWDGQYLANIDQQAAALKLNTVTYEGVANGKFSNLESFLDNTGLYVWPNLMNPINDSAQKPYYDDYERWAEVFADLSLIHPNLDAFLFNDMTPDVNTVFTPNYFRRILQAKNRINPNLRMLPVLYFDTDNMLKYFVPGNAYKPVMSIDGTTIWYSRSYLPGAINMRELKQYFRDAGKYIHPAPYIIGVYPLAKAGTSSPSYHNATDVYNMIAAADNNSEGVILYDVPWTATTQEDKHLHNAIIKAFRDSETTSRF